MSKQTTPSSKQPIPGSAKKGNIDLRSTDAHGRQADEVESHAERAKTKGDGETHRDGETSGAFHDQTAR